MKKFLLLVFAFLIFPFFVLAADKVEINTASLEQLETLTGIGPVKAQAIMDARPFSSIDDLIRVKGIGEITLQKIKDQGLAYVENQAMQPIPQTPIETPPEMPYEALVKPVDVLPTETPPQDVAVPIVYPAGIVINEILPSPEGPDETEEWIEIYNQNDFEVNLSGWRIKDNEGKIATYIFPNNTKIGPKNYLVLTRPQTKITLNNTGDKLTLLQPDGKMVDEIDYSKAPQNQSYNKTNSSRKWSAVLTPRKENVVSILKEVSEKQKSISDKKIGTENNKKLLASLAQDFPRLNKFELLFLIAVVVAILSTIFCYFLKKRLNKI